MCQASLPLFRPRASCLYTDDVLADAGCWLLLLPIQTCKIITDDQRSRPFPSYTSPIIFSPVYFHFLLSRDSVHQHIKHLKFLIIFITYCYEKNQEWTWILFQFKIIPHFKLRGFSIRRLTSILIQIKINICHLKFKSSCAAWMR